MSQYGETLARSVADALHAPVATDAAITAIPTYQRAGGMLVVQTTTGALWQFDADSTAAVGTGVLAPDSGDGRWHAVSGGGSLGVGVGMVHISAVRGASDAALSAYTRTDNVILADANGSINPEDGLTLAVGDRYLLKDGAAGADNGLYRIDAIGGASAKFQMTRVGDADASAEVTAGMLVYVSEGTANGNDWYFLSTDDTITLNTTSLAFVKVPTLTEVTSVETRLSVEECARSDTDSSVGSVETRLSVEESNVDVIRPGVPMQNRLRMLGAPGAIVNADYVTIGADVYEFRNSTPPAGGTAGRIWVYQGANSAASRANFINAINNVTDANNITYDGAVTESMVASAGVTTGDVVVQSATAIGSGVAAPSTTATACTDNLTTATDIWDSATMLYGKALAATQMECVTVTIGAEELAKGDVQVYFGFTPTSCVVSNRSRQQDEAYTISGNAVSLTLAGGGAPNNQSGDVLDFFAQA